MANIDLPTFYLLQLPKKVQKHVCQVMEPISLLGLSICSKVIKSLVKSSGLKCRDVDLHFNGMHITFRNRIVCLSVEPLPDHPGELNLTAHYDPRNYIRADPTVYEWSVPSFTLRDWIDHLLEVCNCRSIEYMYCPDGELEVIQQDFLGLNFKHLSSGFESAEETLQLLKLFPCLKSFKYNAALPDSDFQKLLIQNFDFLELPYAQELSLNDLLLINCVHIETTIDDLTPNELNRFVKLWMKGSNPRLRSIKIPYKSGDELVDKETILRGTNYEDQTEDRKCIIFDRMTHKLVEHTVEGGYEIRRKDGTRARIAIIEEEFEMYISA